MNNMKYQNNNMQRVCKCGLAAMIFSNTAIRVETAAISINRKNRPPQNEPKDIFENMLVMANALDLGSCYINQLTWLSEHEVIRNKLNLSEDEMVCGAVAIGYPNTIDGLPNRQPLERVGNKVSVIE